MSIGFGPNLSLGVRRGQVAAAAGPAVYNFESGIPGIFSDAATQLWTVVTDADAGAGTTKALASKDIGGSQSTEFSFTTPNLPGGLALVRYRVSSEGVNYDRVIFKRNGTNIFMDGGVPGYFNAIAIPLTGADTIAFRYEKDSSGDGGTDDVRISQISFIPSSSVGTFTMDDVPVSAHLHRALAMGWYSVNDADAVGGTTKALASKDIAGAQSTTVAFLCAGSSIAFRYKVSSEAGWDFFRIYKNGVQQLADSGTAGGWETTSFSLDAGVNKIELSYGKDNGGDQGTDDVRISKITIT